jgi:uncharacterized Zn finger protein (UPF0148 family)
MKGLSPRPRAPSVISLDERGRLIAQRRGLGRGTTMTEKVCPECNGEGVVDQDTEDERRCPTCDGTGIVPDDGQGSEEVWNTHPERAMTAKPANRRAGSSRRLERT